MKTSNTKIVSGIVSLALILCQMAVADTPAPNNVKAKTYSGDGTTAITATGSSLDVNVTSPLSATVSSSLGSPVFTQTVFGGSVIDPRARQWSLLNSSDSITAFQGGGSWSFNLPPLAATSTLQSAGNATLSSILSALGGSLSASVSNFPATQPISAASLPLPSNAAKESGGHLESIDTKIQTTANGIKIDSSGVVQPISGAVSVSNFPASQNVNVRDGAGNSISSSSGSLNVAVTNGAISNPSVSATGTAVPASATYVAARDGSANLRGLMVDGAGSLQVDGSGVTQPISGSVSVSNFPSTQPISAAALPLPANAAKESGGNLDSITSKLSSIDGKIKSGQQTMAASAAVVVASDQSAIPVSGSVAVSNFPATQPVSGTVTANQGGAPWAASIVQGGNTAAVSAASALKVDGSAATQPVSAASLPLPANASVESGGHLASLDTKIKAGQQTMAASVGVVLASDQSAIPVSGSITATNPSIGSNGATAPAMSSQVSGQDLSGNLQPISVVSGLLRTDGSAATQPISAVALPLPANAAKESGGNLATIASNGGSILGNQTNGAQKTQQVDGSGNIQPAGDSNARGVHVQPGDGTNAQGYTAAGEAKVLVSPLSSSSTVTAVQGTGTNLHTVVDSGALTANVGTTGGLALDATVGETHAAPAATAPSKTQAIGGVDGTNKLQTLSVTSAGKLNIEGGNASAVKVDGSATTQPISGAVSVSNFPATQPVSGTVTANAGTGTFTVGQATGTNLHTVVDSGALTANIGSTNGLALDATVSNPQGSVAGGTAGSKSNLSGAVYNSTPPVLTNGQQAALQSNASGALKVDGSAATQPVSGTVSASQSGTWTVQPGNTANTTPWLSTINQGGNSAAVTGLNALKVDGSSTTQPISGTVTSNAGTGTFTVGQATAANLNATVVQPTGSNLHANIDSSALPTGAATAANQTAVQGSATGGSAAANSLLTGGVYNSSLVSLSNGQQSSLQVDANGRIIFSAGLASSGTITTTCSTPTTACPAGSFINIMSDGFGSAQVQISGTFSGASLNVDGTLDGVNWVTLLTATGTNGAYSTAAITTTGKYRVYRMASYQQLRVRASALTSGSVVASIQSGNPTDIVEPVQLNPANNLATSYTSDGSGNAISSTAINGKQRLDVNNPASGLSGSSVPFHSNAIGGKDQNGNLQTIDVDTSGRIVTASNSSYSNITTATTTVVKSGAGVLFSICHNKLVNGATITLFDNTSASGNTIGTITQVVGGGADSPSGCQSYGGMAFNTGLTIVTSGASDLTVLYK